MEEKIHSRQNIRDLPDILASGGVEKVVLCPGSRNAPLILSFAKYSNLDCLSIVDERSAAYFAVGMAQFTRKPIVVVCTSGTAVLNCAPAIAEAYYQNIPLIVITADRPAEWIDQADGQTIRQNNIFENYIKASFHISGDVNTTDELWFSNRTVSQALIIANGNIPGPVHLNISFKEPLYTSLPEKGSDRFFTGYRPVGVSDFNVDKCFFANQWGLFPKKWIVPGMDNPDKNLSEILQTLSMRDDTVVITENISNISGKSIISTPESFIASLTEVQKEQFRPDLLITTGHSLVSKRLKQYLRKFKPAKHWHIGNPTGFADTFQSIDEVFDVDPSAFLSMFREDFIPVSNFSNDVERQLSVLNEREIDFSYNLPYSDLYAMQSLFQLIPDSWVIHLANSTSIRYSQLFTSRPGLTFFSNRGTSGIDGCTSTAMGSAYISKLPTVLITGDLAFLYDSNALWNKYISENFKIIVLNNQGGNIFRLIDTTDEISGISNYFETPQSVDIGSLVQAYGLTYFKIDNENGFESVVDSFFKESKPSVLEIITDPEINTKVYKDYFRVIAAK
jgi:2-succinyl-5-enolpyruvyl-6-hydroxy-3-cyclohexene-1-carboxylate synthase